MPNYRYQIRNASGQIQVGVLSADTVASAATVLRNQGAHVLSIAPLAGGGVRNADLLAKLKELNSGKPSQKHVLDFTTQLAVMIRAGINLRSSLDGIAEQTEHAQFRKVIVALKTDVESGKQFSEAIARHPKLFGPLYVNMVRASEMSGSFS
ncbi:MAG: type II secretion system F family protein [Phycisphaerales bacterium]